MEGSWEVYKLMEAWSDGWGAWRYLPYPGSLLEQPEALMDDLMTWRWLGGKVKHQNREDNDSE